MRTLFYERFKWNVTGERCRALVAEVLSDSEIPCVLQRGLWIKLNRRDSSEMRVSIVGQWHRRQVEKGSHSP